MLQTNKQITLHRQIQSTSKCTNERELRNNQFSSEELNFPVERLNKSNKSTLKREKDVNKSSFRNNKDKSNAQYT